MNPQPWKLAGLLLLALFLVACGGNGGGKKKEPPSASKSAADLRVTAQREIEIKDARLLSLSPDGQWLAAQTEADQLCIYRAEASAKQACALLDQVRPSLDSIAWSPDSTRIAFTDDAFRAMFESDIWLLETESGKLTNLTDDGVVGGILRLEPEGARAWVDTVPAWSPDGKNLVFSRSVFDQDETRQTDLYRISASGGGAEKLFTVSTEYPMAVWYGTQWSDDGKHIFYNAYLRKPDDPNGGVWTVDQDGKNAEQLIGPDPDLGPPFVVDVAPRQDKLLFVYYQALGSLGTKPNVSFFYLLDLKTGATTPIKQAQSDEIEFFTPNNAILSPDGSKVLYVYRTLEKEWRLAVRDLDGETEHILATFDEPVGASREMGLGLNWATDDTLYVARALGQAGLLLTLGTD